MDNLNALPTETLVSLAMLTHRLRAEQRLRALDSGSLREMMLLAKRANNEAVANLIQKELDNR